MAGKSFWREPTNFAVDSGKTRRWLTLRAWKNDAHITIEQLIGIIVFLNDERRASTMASE